MVYYMGLLLGIYGLKNKGQKPMLAWEQQQTTKDKNELICSIDMEGSWKNTKGGPREWTH